VTYHVKLEVFEGPLDLLLQSIRREALEITAVSLAAVTDQYLAYLEQLQEIDPGALASFLEVAAQLVLIKSRRLLPRPPADPLDEEEEDPAEMLARRLRQYAMFKEAARALQEREAQGLRAYVRITPPPELPQRDELGGLSIDDLLAAMQQALNTRPARSVSHVIEPIKVTIDDRSEVIRQALLRSWPMSFQSLLRDCRSRIEIIVTFLALLELVKAGEISVWQDALFGEIMIEPVIPFTGSEHQWAASP
jgi:segregation and condensation protein A